MRLRFFVCVCVYDYMKLTQKKCTVLKTCFIYLYNLFHICIFSSFKYV
jgi:hypothetical protein